MVLTLAVTAAGPVIGVAVSEGTLRLNQATVQGNANVEAGNVVASLASEVRVRLSNGASAFLTPSSAARFDGQSVELQAGGGVFANSSNYPVNAVGFNIRPEGGSKAQLYLDKGQLQVGAVGGPVRISNREGILVARVMPGKALAVTPALANDRTSTMTGTLRQSEGRWLLRDEVTSVESELRGSMLNGAAGKRVVVTGKASASNGQADQVIEVARLVPAPEQAGAARPTGQTGSSRPGSSVPPVDEEEGMSTGAKVAIIAVVGGGAAAGIVFATMSR
jgi:hypothetical protein